MDHSKKVEQFACEDQKCGCGNTVSEDGFCRRQEEVCLNVKTLSTWQIYCNPLLFWRISKWNGQKNNVNTKQIRVTVFAKQMKLEKKNRVIHLLLLLKMKISQPISTTKADDYK